MSEANTPPQAVEAYFARLRQELDDHPLGAWLGREEHQEAFQAALGHKDALPPVLTKLLREEPSLPLRFEAVRLAAAADRKDELLPVIDGLLERAGFYPLVGRRLRGLASRWHGTQKADQTDVAAHKEKLQHLLWFAPPAQAQDEMKACLEAIAAEGEPGLFWIDCFLGHMLEEHLIMASDVLFLFETAAQLFDQHRYFDGVQVFFDFLADCKPRTPDSQIQSAVGAVLKAVRKLRPYRYPQWAAPLRRFVKHYKKIKKFGRAAEANMLIILITASSVEEALLLEDDELVDLLRGRRDCAYTEEELDAVAQLCDAAIDAGREDCRIFHIRGWLAARLDGPEFAEPYFHKAVSLNPKYIYSHLALASLSEMRGDESSRNYHMAEACSAEPSLISCHRKYGELLEEQGRIVEAQKIYRRGTQQTPDQVSPLELEELFGCYANLARIHTVQGHLDEALHELDRLFQSSLEEQFSARFVQKERVIVELLHKGALDLRAELTRQQPPA